MVVIAQNMYNTLMADEPPATQQEPQEKPAQQDVTISLHAPTDPPQNLPEPSAAAQVPGQTVAPQAPTTLSPSPAPQAPLAPGQPVAQPAAPGTIPAQAPAQAPAGPVKLQWCPTDQVGVIQPDAGNTCPACGAQLVPMPPEFGPEGAEGAAGP